MADEILVRRISREVAETNGIPIRQTDTTRLVIKARLVRNPKDEHNSVEFTLIHQRIGNLGNWENAPVFDLRTLRAGQEVPLPLDTESTHNLLEILQQLYQLYAEYGLPDGEGHYRIVDTDSTLVLRGREKATIEDLLSHEGDQFWEHIEQLKPGLLSAVVLKKQHEERRNAVDIFRQHFDGSDWAELDWQRFFENNKWIFGHNLAFQFVNQVIPHPRYASATVFGRDGQTGDYLLSTAGGHGFTVLVDIKTPGKPLLKPGEPYRNRAYAISTDLAGGVAQMQSNCDTWATEGSQNKRTDRELCERDVSTYRPKGILVIGNLRELDNNEDKCASFELFRRNLSNPEVLTFDELLQRAEFTVSLEEQG